MDISKLSAQFPENLVHWRVQGKPYQRNGKWSAMALAYIDARDVMDRLDDVCGPENWQVEHIETPRGRILTRIGVKIGGEWVWKSDGAGETAVEGEKGGISDGIKRAAVHWGIGRYLYRLSSPWVACLVNEKNGNIYWKSWAESPWSKTAEIGYQRTIADEDDESVDDKRQNARQDTPKQPEQPKQSTPAELRDKLKKAIADKTTMDALSAMWKHQMTIDALAGLPEPMRLEVTTAYNNRYNAMEAAQ